MHPSNGLHVVAQDFWFGGDDGVQLIVPSLMVADQAFDTGVRAGFMHALDGLGPDGGATIRQVVAVNTGDDDMSQSHEGDGFCDTTGLVVVDFSGSARLDVAKATRSGAGVPQDHDGGRPAVPAFTHVWTGRFFADRVQSMRVHDLTESLIARAAGHPGSEPVGFAAKVELLSLVVVEHHSAERHLDPTPVLGGVSSKGSGMAGQCSILGRFAHVGYILPPQNLVNRIPSAR